MAKLPLRFPRKLELGSNKLSRRTLFAGAHVCLAINPITVFLGGLPIAGTLAALGVLLTARLAGDALENDLLRQGYNRVALGISLLFLGILLIQTTDLLHSPWQAWFALGLIQTPLGLYDAWSVWRGNLGLTLRGYDKF